MIIRIYQQAGLAVDDRVERPADVAGHHGKSVSVGLEKDDSKSLTAHAAPWNSRGHREDVGPIEPRVAFGV